LSSIGTISDVVLRIAMTRAQLKLWAEFHAHRPTVSSRVERKTEADMVLSWIERGTEADLRFAEVHMDQHNWFRPPGVPERTT
jgi:hypothetical protein